MSNALTPEQQRAMVAAYTIPLPEPAFGFLVVSEETGQWIESRAGEAAFDADNLHALDRGEVDVDPHRRRGSA